MGAGEGARRGAWKRMPDGGGGSLCYQLGQPQAGLVLEGLWNGGKEVNVFEAKRRIRKEEE